MTQAQTHTTLLTVGLLPVLSTSAVEHARMCVCVHVHTCMYERAAIREEGDSFGNILKARGTEDRSSKEKRLCLSLFKSMP